MIKTEHDICVETWLEEQASGQTTAQLLRLFDRALRALWQRTERPLGDVTLRAIADRVLHTACPPKTCPTFRLGPDGVEIVDGVGSPEELIEAMRLFLVEFLTVLGNLTAEILTPALHQELRGVVAGAGSLTSRRSPKASRPIDEEKS
jgi:hypothetical protein